MEPKDKKPAGDEEHKEGGSQESNDVGEFLTEAFERVATTAERVGMPLATFTAGAITIGLSAQVTAIPILPWLGTGLILAALATYVWMTARSTITVQSPPPLQSPPPPIQAELKELIDWMREEITKQNEWTRKQNESGKGSKLQ